MYCFPRPSRTLTFPSKDDIRTRTRVDGVAKDKDRVSNFARWKVEVRGTSVL